MPGPSSEPLINTDTRKPYLSSSYQVAPAIQDYRPVSAQQPNMSSWYDEGIEYGANSSLNIFFYGMDLEGQTKPQSYTADAISANTNIDDSFFDEFHAYRLEWQPPGKDKEGKRSNNNGYLKWFLDGQLVYSISSEALQKSGALVPVEPMYLIMNTAISSSWGFPIPCPEVCTVYCIYN